MHTTEIWLTWSCFLQSHTYACMYMYFELHVAYYADPLDILTRYPPTALGALLMAF